MMRRVRVLFGVALFVFFCSAAARADQGQVPWKTSLLSSVVDIRDVKFHQRMLELIASRNDDNRASGTAGYDQSAQYVVFWLKAAGYQVDIQEFKIPFFLELSDPLLQRTFPEAEPYQPDSPQGFYTAAYSGSGDVEGIVVPVDVMMPPGDTPNSSTSGCEAADFSDFPAGAIALIQRGTCSFDDKAKNAERAGASAVVIYNEGQVDRRAAFRTNLQMPQSTIPVVIANYAIGRELYNLGRNREVRLHIRTDTRTEWRMTQNVLAATRTGAPSRKVVVGAHLDSVTTAPGINDNGSGAAAVLETAVKMAQWGIRPKNKVVFAFWGAEEIGLLGSTHYVDKLTRKQLAGISLYLNFDMIGSPNWIRFVGDGDGSDTGVAGPPGSGLIEQVFVDYFKSRNMPTEPHTFNGRSDYAPFIDAGIPVGELLAGWDEIKTKREAAIYGGKAGEPCDPNYHTRRDTLKHISLKIEKQILSAIGYAVEYFACGSLPVPKVAEQREAKPFPSEYRGPLLVR